MYPLNNKESQSETARKTTKTNFIVISELQGVLPVTRLIRSEVKPIEGSTDKNTAVRFLSIQTFGFTQQFQERIFLISGKVDNLARYTQLYAAST